MKEKKFNRIKEVLKEKGRSNKWLSAQLSKNEVTVSRWCRNVQQPDIETLYQIAALLEVRVGTLLEENPPNY